jgi:hypothetical protein
LKSGFASELWRDYTIKTPNQTRPEMPPKRKADAATEPEKQPKGGARAGAGRKPADKGLGNDKLNKKTPTQVSLTTLLGSRQAPAPTPTTSATPAAAQPSPATAPAPLSGEPRFDEESLGPAWHAIIGYGDQEGDEAIVEEKLKAHPECFLDMW